MSDERDPKTPPEGPSRRDLLDGALVGGAVLLGGSTLYPIVRFLGAKAPLEEGDLEVVAAKASEIAAGTAVTFHFGNKPALLVRDHFGKLRAFLAICTHLGCVVQHRADMGHIWCACHNGHFDLSGQNIAGPPPRPLESFVVNVRGTQIVVSKSA